jgi:hypothetical protein
MKKTIFAGLTILEPGEGLSTDNGSFVDADPQIVDRLLEIGAKTHRHTGLAGLSNPSGAPVASIVASGGALPSDLAISVGYTLEDSQGGETLLSPITVVGTPGEIPAPPAAPSAQVSHAAGQLEVNTYYYATTFVDNEGGETELGPAVNAERQPGFASGQVILTQLSFGMAAAGAAGWRLYRAVGGDTFNLLATGSGDEFVDDGSQPVSCDVHPPAGEQNTTVGSSSLLVTLPSAVPGQVFINVYASISGDFGGSSLLGQFPLASAGQIAVFRSLEFFDVNPPSVNLSIGGAHQIDPDTELLDWHWKRPVLASGALGSGVTGDVRLVKSTGELYAVLAPSAVASGASEWVRIASAGGGGSGSVGPQGPTGPQGPEGPAGPKGASGASGAIGLTGPQGPTGLTGATGPQGPTGPGDSWKPPVFASASLGSGVLGDVKMVEQEGELYGVLSASASTASAWVKLSSASTLEASATQGIVAPVQRLTIRASGVAIVDIVKQSAGRALYTVTVPPVAGPQGPEGPKGASGASGAIGLTGPTGPQGPEGPAGPKGASGASGAIGLTGPQGPQGEKGTTGEKGEPGETGPKGETGSTGATGGTGPQGPIGPGNSWKPPVLASGSLGSGVLGDVKMVEQEGELYGVLSASASVASGWVRLSSASSLEASATQGLVAPVQRLTIRASGVATVDIVKQSAGRALYTVTVPPVAGPQGPQGVQGEKGTTGEKGEKGEKGSTGEKGETGSTGSTGATGGTGPQGPVGPGNSWKPPVLASGSLGSGVLGDVKMVEQDGQIYGVLGASATVASGWTRLASGILTASANNSVPGVAQLVNKLTFEGAEGVRVAISQPKLGEGVITVKAGAGGLIYKGESSTNLATTNLACLRKNKEKWSEVTEICLSIESLNWTTAEDLLLKGMAVGSVIVISVQSEENVRPIRQMFKITSIESTANGPIAKVVGLSTTSTATANEIAFKELEVEFYAPFHYGLVTALPASPRLLDRCSFIADETNGVIWELLYDGEGTRPWKKIGGPPLFNEVATQETIKSATYANLATEGPSVKVPLLGDYDVAIGAGIGSFSPSVEINMSYAIGGTAAVDADCLKVFPGPNGCFVEAKRVRRKASIAKNTTLLSKYKISGGEGSFYFRWMSVDPIRVG